MRKRISSRTLVLAFVTAVAGCGDAAGPQRSFRAAAGIYLLATVNGQTPPISDVSAPIEGAVYLWPTGHAERHLVYRRFDGGTEAVESVGSFHFEGDALVLELRPKDAYTLTPGRVTAAFDGTKLTIGYPGPADGWISEEYRRK